MSYNTNFLHKFPFQIFFQQSSYLSCIVFKNTYKYYNAWFGEITKKNIKNLKELNLLTMKKFFCANTIKFNIIVKGGRKLQFRDHWIQSGIGLVEKKQDLISDFFTWYETIFLNIFVHSVSTSPFIE